MPVSKVKSTGIGRGLQVLTTWESDTRTGTHTCSASGLPSRVGGGGDSSNGGLVMEDLWGLSL